MTLKGVLRHALGMDEELEDLDLQKLSITKLYIIAGEGAPEYRQIAATALTINDSLSLEDIGQKLNETMYREAYYESDFWRACKQELYCLFCTRDPKYNDIRKRIYGSGGRAEMVIVSTIAAAVAGSAGLMAGALVPFCAVCLIAAVKVGTEAFCHSVRNDLPPTIQGPVR